MPPATLGTRCRSETCSRTSTACAARWTSCSATCSSAPGCRAGATGFSPAVDVAYTSDPPRAIVTAELAGVEIDELELEIQGRKLILSGRRGPAAVEGDVYQQVEIERGQLPPRDRARRRRARRGGQGALRGRDAAGRAAARARASRACARCRSRARRDERRVIEVGVPDGGPRDVAVGGTPRAARARRRAAAARHGHLPGHADPAQRRPGAQHRADQRRAARRPLDRDGRQPQPGGRDARRPRTSTRSACSASSRG